MKRTLAIFLALVTLIASGFAIRAAELQPIPFAFTGRWQPSEDPVLLDDNGLQDIQNLRKHGKHFKGISGHTTINASTISTYPNILSGFHFRKDLPAESHVLVVSGDTVGTPTTTVVSQLTVAIPGTGNFSSTLVHTDTTEGIGNGRFSSAPNGQVVYANGPETLIWGGNEIHPTAFIVSTASLSGTTTILTNPTEYTDQVTNTRQTTDQVALIGGGIDTYTKLMLHGDGLTDGSTTITDSEPTPKTITWTAATCEIDMAQHKFGNGSILIGSEASTHMTAADSADWYFGSDAFTIDFWARFSSLPANGKWKLIFSQRSDSSNFVFYGLYNSAGTYSLAVGTVIGGASDYLFNHPLPTAPSLNTWYHIALIRGWGGSTNTWASTINGSAASTSSKADAYPDIAGTLRIGGDTDLAAYGGGFDGWLDELRISKGIARWTANFTPYQTAYRDEADHWIVGFTRPIQGVKFYISDPNKSTSTMTAQEWNGSSWTDLTITDNTASGGITMAQTGTVTFSSTVDTAKQRYIHGYSLYWYQFNISAGKAAIYYVTGDAPIQAIRNIWDGRQSYVTKALKYQTDYKEYTDEVNDDLTSTVMDVSSMPNTAYILLGFTAPQQAVEITMEPDSENATTSNAMTAAYWNGQEWTVLPALSDGTATTTKSLNKSGVVAWHSPGPVDEFPVAIGDETPLYYYKLSFDGTLDNDTKIGEVRGIEAPLPVATYRLSEMHQGRLFLLNEYNGQRNKVIYSMDNAPDVFNGDDTGEFYVGDQTDITAAVTVYNVFGNTAYDQMIIGKEGEIWRLAGDGPTTWAIKRISPNVGCVAPQSMVSVEVTGEDETQRRQVAIFQGDRGFYMTDGATVKKISGDINCYFDQNDSRYIPTTRRNKTIAWYDPSIRAYKAVISSGSTATYHNLELEYSLDNREWTKIYREDGSGADPLQAGWRVYDTNGLSYTYGGNKGGQVYRLENGSTFAGTGITQYIHTKDLIMDQTAPLFRKSTIKHMRTALKKKTNGGTVSIAHYGDQTLTVNGSSNQVVPSSITVATAPYNTQSCNLGPFLYHSFKLTASAATVSDGMELIGIGLWAEPYTAVR